MSLDLVVWLGCSLALPQALPKPEIWTHKKISLTADSGVSPELAASLDGREYWYVEQPFLVTVSLAPDEPSTLERLHEVAPEIQVHNSVDEAAPLDSEEAMNQTVLQAETKHAVMSISLVLEGVTESGTEYVFGVARSLAKQCGGAIVESPVGFYRLNEKGEIVDE